MPLLCVPDHPSGARTARRWVTSQLPPCSAQVRDTIALVVSEMVSNALVHGRGPVSVRVDVVRSHARIAVADHNPDVESVLDGASMRDELAVGGRGLVIVDHLASRWGVSRCSDHRGKVIWCEIDLSHHHVVPAPR